MYGTTQREHRTTPAPRLVELDPQILALAAAGQSTASIAFRLGTTKRHVAEVLTRRETA